MTDYRALIAPFLNHERKPTTTGETIKKYTGYITQSIDFLEAGHFEPDEAFYSALKAHLLEKEKLAASTTKSRVSLSRRFFTWILKQQGDTQATMTDINNSIPSGDDKAAKSTFDEAGRAAISEQVQAPNEKEPAASSNVDAHAQQSGINTNDNPGDVMQPQDTAAQASRQEKSKKTGGRPKKYDEEKNIKLSVYLTPTLDADLKDLARIQRLSTSDYIFRLIERERDRRADALAAFRALVDDD